jgi:hypothetical protein
MLHIFAINLTSISKNEKKNWWKKGNSNIKNLTWGKNDQHIKIYLPCNFEVNFIIYFAVITLFSSNFQHFNTFRPCWTCLQFKLNIYL